MNYHQFLENIKERVELKITKEHSNTYNVVINHVLKNNSIELDGLSIFNEEDNISPTIYLNSYYGRYLGGDTLDELAAEILMIYLNKGDMNNHLKKDFNFTFEEVQKTIIYRLVSYDKNLKILDEIPHIRFLDLAITFHCLARSDEQGIGTIRITNEYMDLWGTNTQQLFQLANVNTPALFPEKICPIEEILEDLIDKEIAGMLDTSNIPEVLKKDIKDFISDPEDCGFDQLLEFSAKIPMYIITNEKGINGASAVIYTDLLKRFADKVNSDLYILPSSIHEVILIPYSHGVSKDTLMNMVSEVNQTQIPEEEYLSDHVYLFNRATNSIEL